MRWLLTALLLFSSMAMAEPELLPLFSDGRHLLPQAAIARAEAENLGEIIDYEAEYADGELVYEFHLIDTAQRLLYELEFRGTDGTVLEKKSRALNKGDERLQLAALLQQKQQKFSALVALALVNTQGYLQEAELNQDLGISYLELKVLDEHGTRKLAFDIEHQRQLPLLKWD